MINCKKRGKMQLNCSSLLEAFSNTRIERNQRAEPKRRGQTRRPKREPRQEARKFVTNWYQAGKGPTCRARIALYNSAGR